MSNVKVLSVPHLEQLGKGESGIHTVIRAYFRHAPRYGIDFVPPGATDYDVLAVHAGMSGAYPANGNIVAHTHGLYWTDDYQMGKWAYNANRHVIDVVRHAKEITVPSPWVAESFQRDMRVNPTVIPHGIDWERWQHKHEPAGYVLAYAKNRAGMDVCNPSFLLGFASRFPHVEFAATFVPKGTPDNVTATGVISHEQMRELVQKCNVFMSTTKETWGIAILEAMAAGKPILAFAQGGANDLIQHGVTGYLARPDDYEDLANGLVYCIQHALVLGANGREHARSLTWDVAMERLANVYGQAREIEPASVSVIIPVFNKSRAQLARAIGSAKAQTFPAHELIVVNDGSSGDVDYKAIAVEGGARYIEQGNLGVAEARNTGVRASTGKYILCLDADDAIEPLFLEACVPELEKDNSLGIAYTGLQWIKADGSTGLSEWPGDFNYDNQLKGQNQVPTAAVFRREAWRRVGGYHQRYAPAGAGEEDANFWTRIPSIGYSAKKVTTAGLFLYSWESGFVSGNRDHSVTDWRYWLPWTRDSGHPFASVASPHKLSHPVRQYDEPAVSVVIPVGPGHETLVFNALDSLEAQTFRKWEAIVVWDTMPLWKMKRAYPYVRTVNTYVTQQEVSSKGAGFARNRGVEIARAPFLLFLDADDQLHPDCLSDMLQAYGETGAAIYSDYIGKAYVDNPEELAENLQENLLEYDSKSKEAVIQYKASTFERERAMQQPMPNPYIWNNVTTLFPKVWHDEIGGFDEDMPSWEDVDYWWRMAWLGKNFHRIDKPLMVYRFYSGGRRDTGVKNYDALMNYMGAKKREYVIRGM